MNNNVRAQCKLDFFQPPPVPFEYKFSAGRAPGGKPDRYVSQKGDEHGVVEVCRI